MTPKGNETENVHQSSPFTFASGQSLRLTVGKACAILSRLSGRFMTGFPLRRIVSSLGHDCKASKAPASFISAKWK